MLSESDYETSFIIEEGNSSLPDIASSTDGHDCHEPTSYRKEDLSFVREESELSNAGSGSDAGGVEDDIIKAKRRKRVNLAEEELRLECEWAQCEHPVYKCEALPVSKKNDKERLLNDFISHVEMHAREICAVDDSEDVLSCLWNECGFETTDREEAAVHVNYHTYHTKLKCIGTNVKARTEMPECMYGKSNVNTLPEPLETLVCLWDDCTFASQNMLTFLSHVNSHFDRIGPRSYHCKCLWKDCKIELDHESKLRAHVRVHTKEKVVACPDCGAMFACNTKLLDHCTRQLPVELQGYQCSHCRRHYPSERILRDHMRSHIKRYKCVYCDMTCATHTTLATHIRVRHIRHRPFRCPKCSFRCESKQDLLNHSQIHEMRDRFICEQPDCEFTCRSNQTLKMHFLKEHEGIASPYNVYECHECDRQYSRGTYLTTHLKRDHGLQWPSGHKRFAYRPGEDGKYRLQRIRYESLEVSDEIHSTSIDNIDENDMDDTLEKRVIENKSVKIRLRVDELSKTGSPVEYELTIGDIDSQFN